MSLTLRLEGLAQNRSVAFFTDTSRPDRFGYPYSKRIVKLKTLMEFWELRSDTKLALRAWYAEAKGADWRISVDARSQKKALVF